MLFNDRTGISEVSCQTRPDEVTANYKAQVAGYGNEKVSWLLERSLTDTSTEITSLFTRNPLLSFRGTIFYSFNRFWMKLTRPRLFKRSDHAAKCEWGSNYHRGILFLINLKIFCPSKLFIFIFIPAYKHGRTRRCAACHEECPRARF